MRDLAKVFATLKEHKLRLNTTKCAFRVNSKKFLGNLVTRRGIEANSEQIVQINDLVNPRTAKEFQKLTVMTAILNWFISKSFDKCRSFFQLLRKNIKFL